jgi:hypothetical protein
MNLIVKQPSDNKNLTLDSSKATTTLNQTHTLQTKWTSSFLALATSIDCKSLENHVLSLLGYNFPTQFNITKP